MLLTSNSKLKNTIPRTENDFKALEIENPQQAIIYGFCHMFIASWSFLQRQPFGRSLFRNTDADQYYAAIIEVFSERASYIKNMSLNMVRFFLTSYDGINVFMVLLQRQPELKNTDIYTKKFVSLCNEVLPHGYQLIQTEQTWEIIRNTREYRVTVYTVPAAPLGIRILKSIITIANLILGSLLIGGGCAWLGSLIGYHRSNGNMSISSYFSSPGLENITMDTAYKSLIMLWLMCSFVVFVVLVFEARKKLLNWSDSSSTSAYDAVYNRNMAHTVKVEDVTGWAYGRAHIVKPEDVPGCANKESFGEGLEQ